MPLRAFLCAAAVPVVLWHHTIAAIAADVRLDPGYLSGLALSSQVVAAVG